MLKQIATNLLSNYLLTLVSMVLGFVLVPFLIHKLGKEAYGLIVLAESTMLLFEIITTSIRIALSRHAAFCFAQDKKEEFVDYLSTGRVVTYFSAALVFLFALGLSRFFSRLFNVPSEYAAGAGQLFFTINLAFMITIINSIYWSVLYAHNRFDLINIATSGGLIVRAVFLLVFFSVLPVRYLTLPNYGFVYLAMVVVDNALVFRWSRKIMPGLRPSLKRFKKDKLRQILSFTTYSSLSRVSNVLYDSSANIIINRFWGPAANAMFSIALKFPSIMERLFVNAAWSLTPTLTDYVARNEREKLSMLYSTYMKLITTITTPLCLILSLMAGPLIFFWVGPEFAPAARMLPILMIPLFMTIPYAISGCIVNAYAKVKVPSQLGFLVAVANVILGLLLGKVFSLGLFGMAVAWAVCALFFMFILASYACRVSSLPFWKYFRGAYLKPMLWSAMVVGTAFGAARIFHFDLRVRPGIVLAIAFLILIDYAGAYFVVLSATEQKQVKDTFKAMFSKLGAGSPQEAETAGLEEP